MVFQLQKSKSDKNKEKKTRVQKRTLEKAEGGGGVWPITMCCVESHVDPA